MDFSVHYDVAVAGGGVAGVAAAVAAARRGLKTALVEKQTLLGGLAASGLVFIYLPLCDGRGTQIIYGISEEMLRRSVEFSPFDIPDSWQNNQVHAAQSYADRYSVMFSPASLILTMDEMLCEANVDIWLDTRVCDAVKSGDRITAITVENSSGHGSISANCFVDATGEALLVRRGGGTLEGDWNSLSMWLLENSPEAPDSEYYFTGNIHINSFKYHINDIAPLAALDGKNVSQYTSKCYAELREYYRQSYKKTDRFHHYPLTLPSMPQFRKIAAARCLKMLDSFDSYKSFEDSIGMTGDWRQSGPVWETPLSALIPETLDGIFTAGRCMGAVNDAWEVYRVIPTAAMTGEAAGIAAAISVESGIPSRELPAVLVQNELRKLSIPLHFEDVNLHF